MVLMLGLAGWKLGGGCNCCGVQNSLVVVGWTLCGQGSIPPREDCFIVITTTSLNELLPKLQNTILDSRQMYDSYENKVTK